MYGYRKWDAFLVFDWFQKSSVILQTTNIYKAVWLAWVLDAFWQALRNVKAARFLGRFNNWHRVTYWWNFITNCHTVYSTITPCQPTFISGIISGCSWNGPIKYSIEKGDQGLCTLFKLSIIMLLVTKQKLNAQQLSLVEWKNKGYVEVGIMVWVSSDNELFQVKNTDGISQYVWN